MCIVLSTVTEARRGRLGAGQSMGAWPTAASNHVGQEQRAPGVCTPSLRALSMLRTSCRTRKRYAKLNCGKQRQWKQTNSMACKPVLVGRPEHNASSAPRYRALPQRTDFSRVAVNFTSNCGCRYFLLNRCLMMAGRDRNVPSQTRCGRAVQQHESEAGPLCA